MEIIRNSNCPKCFSASSTVKNGKYRDGRQTYICKSCKRSFIANPKKTRITKGKSKKPLKELVYEEFKKYMKESKFVINYSESARKLKVTRETIYRWVKIMKREGVKFNSGSKHEQLIEFLVSRNNQRMNKK